MQGVFLWRKDALSEHLFMLSFAFVDENLFSLKKLIQAFAPERDPKISLGSIFVCLSVCLGKLHFQINLVSPSSPRGNLATLDFLSGTLAYHANSLCPVSSRRAQGLVFLSGTPFPFHLNSNQVKP